MSLAFTLYMTGMIWSMQVFEYPLFAKVGFAEFPAYHAAHNHSLPLFVIVPSFLALVSAVVMFWRRPGNVPLWSVAIAVALDLAVIVSTAAIQAPLHAKLDREGFSAQLISALVRSNWIRAALWTANSLLFLALTAKCLSKSG